MDQVISFIKQSAYGGMLIEPHKDTRVTYFLGSCQTALRCKLIAEQVVKTSVCLCGKLRQLGKAVGAL